MTMNMHQLKHLSECVKHWGPLWGYSCFCFESLNGHLKKLFHGTKDMSVQVRNYKNNFHCIIWNNIDGILSCCYAVFTITNERMCTRYFSCTSYG